MAKCEKVFLFAGVAFCAAQPDKTAKLVRKRPEGKVSEEKDSFKRREMFLHRPSNFQVVIGV